MTQPWYQSERYDEHADLFHKFVSLRELDYDKETICKKLSIRDSRYVVLERRLKRVAERRGVTMPAQASRYTPDEMNERMLFVELFNSAPRSPRGGRSGTKYNRSRKWICEQMGITNTDYSKLKNWAVDNGHVVG